MMDQPLPMRTLSQVLEKFKTKGYDNELLMQDGKHLVNEKNGQQYLPTDLHIIKTYRFEGNSDPGDNVVIYLVKDKSDKLSYIMDAYGAESNNKGEAFDAFLRDIPVGDEISDD